MREYMGTWGSARRLLTEWTGWLRVASGTGSSNPHQMDSRFNVGEASVGNTVALQKNPSVLEPSSSLFQESSYLFLYSYVVS